jgi:signal transduction histidine kinase
MCHSSGVRVGERTGRRSAGRWPARRAAPQSARAVVRRELTWLAVVGLAAWVIETPQLWPWRSTGLAAAALWLVVLAWLLLLGTQLRGQRDARRLARAGIVAAVVLAAAVLSVPATSQVTWEAGASLAVLSGGLAGLLLPSRPALAVIGLAVVATLEVTWRLASGPGPLGLPTPFVPAYALALGVSLMVLRAALERNAARVDGDIARRDEVERQRGTVSGVEETLRRQERQLHETVLNTLTAICRGGLGTQPESGGALQARCREAIDVLDHLNEGAQALAPPAVVTPTGFVAIGEDLSATIDGIRADGLPVEVVADSLEGVPDRVRGALGTAIREALSNTARHARASGASVLIRVHQEDGIRLRAEVRDDGVGFDPRTTPSRFGLARAVVGPMEEVGGSATLVSQPGQGTRVVLEWQARRPDALDRAPWRGFVLPPAATVSVFAAAMVVLAWIEFNHPPATLADIALISVLAVLIALATPEAPLPWSLVVTVAALGPLLALLSAASGGTPVLGGGWALAAVAALYMVVAAIGPPWAWVVLLVSWLVGEGEVTTLLSDVVVLVIIGGAVFGRALRRDFVAMERSQRRRRDAEMALDVTRQAVARLRSRYEALADSTAPALLEGILCGALDAEDPAVGLEESFIRTLIRIDPDADDLRRLAAGLSRTAHRREVPLSIELALPPAPEVVVPAPLAGSLTAAMAAAAADAPARFTARQVGDSVLATLLVTVDEGEVVRMQALPVPGDVTDPDDPSDRTLLWEASLPLHGSS